MSLSEEEKDIIRDAMESADAFGTGRLSNAKEQIEDYGFKWTSEHEDFLFEEGKRTASALKFSSEEEALQYLANVTGKRVKLSNQQYSHGWTREHQRRVDNMTPEEDDTPDFNMVWDSAEVEKDVKEAIAATEKKLKSVGADDVNLKADFDYIVNQKNKYEVEGQMTIDLNIEGDDIIAANDKMGSQPLGGDPEDGERIFHYFYSQLGLDNSNYEGHNNSDYELSGTTNPGKEVQWFVYLYFDHDYFVAP